MMAPPTGGRPIAPQPEYDRGYWAGVTAVVWPGAVFLAGYCVALFVGR